MTNLFLILLDQRVAFGFTNLLNDDLLRSLSPNSTNLVLTEWFTVETGELYRVHVLADGSEGDSAALVRLGSELIAGLPLELDAGETRRMVVEPLGPPSAPINRRPAGTWNWHQPSGLSPPTSFSSSSTQQGPGRSAAA